jgi:hypothetical protein
MPLVTSPRPSFSSVHPGSVVSSVPVSRKVSVSAVTASASKVCVYPRAITQVRLPGRCWPSSAQACAGPASILIRATSGAG